MTQHGMGGGSSSTTPSEEVILVHVGLFAIGTIIASAGALWLAGAQWLIDQQVLVAAAETPLLVIPGTAGAGLDLQRICIGAGVLLAALVLTVSWARRQIAVRRSAAMM